MRVMAPDLVICAAQTVDALGRSSCPCRTVAKVDAALEEFPGRITRDEWVAQAADLDERFPDGANRRDRRIFLNEAPD